MWIHVQVWLSPFIVHLKLSQDCLISYTPIQSKKFLLKSVLFSFQPPKSAWNLGFSLIVLA